MKNVSLILSSLMMGSLAHAGPIISPERAITYLKQHEPQFKHIPAVTLKPRLHISDFGEGFSQVCYGVASDYADCWVIKDDAAFTDYFEAKARELLKSYDQIVVVVRNYDVTSKSITIHLDQEEELYAFEINKGSVRPLALIMKTIAGYSRRLQPSLLVAHTSSPAAKNWGRTYLITKPVRGARDRLPELREATKARISFLTMNRASPEVRDGSVARALRNPSEIAGFAGARPDGSFNFSQWGAMPDLILGVDGRDKRILLSNGSANEQDIPTGPIRVQLKRIYR